MTPHMSGPRPGRNRTGTGAPTRELGTHPKRTSESAFGRIAPRCPDCTAVAVGGEFWHDETCPAALAMDRVQDDDAAWFRANPQATVRRRPATDAEALELSTSGVARPRPGAVVEVIQLAPGLRTRHVINGGEPQ